MPDVDRAPTLRSHLTLALCALLHAFTHAYGTMLVPLYLLIVADLGLSGAGAASLIVTVYGVVYCLVSYPAGVLADRGNRKALLGVGLIVNALAIGLMGLTRRYEVLVMLGVLAGLAGTLFHPAANALATAHYPEAPGMAVGVLSMGAGLGFFAGPQYAGWRADVAGWQAPLVEAGLFGVAGGAVFLLVAQEVRKRPAAGTAEGVGKNTGRDSAPALGLQPSALPLNGDGNGAGAGIVAYHGPPARAPLGRPLRNRMLAVSVGLAGRDFAGIASISLASIYLQKARGLSVRDAGFILGAMMLIAIVVNPIAVYLSPGRRRLPAMAIILVAGGLVLATIPAVPVAYALPVLCGFQAFHLGSYAVSEAAMLERVSPAVRGRVIGVFLTIAGTVAGTGPWLMGAWTDAMGLASHDPRAYRLPFAVLGSLLAVSALSTLLIRRLGPAPVSPQVEPVAGITPATLEVVG